MPPHSLQTGRLAGTPLALKGVSRQDTVDWIRHCLTLLPHWYATLILQATGKEADTDGDMKLKFMTNEGQGRALKMQCADVNKCLGSVGGITDADNLVIFSKHGGVITPKEGTKIILPKDKSLVTKFERKGMVYRMDAWLKKSDVQAKPEDFPRRVNP